MRNITRAGLTADGKQTFPHPHQNHITFFFNEKRNVRKITQCQHKLQGAKTDKKEAKWSTSPSDFIPSYLEFHRRQKVMWVWQDRRVTDDKSSFRSQIFV